MRPLFLALVVLALSSPAAAQDAAALELASRLDTHYVMQPNITYLTAGGYEAKLDLYVARLDKAPAPTVIFIHGGGWSSDTNKESRGVGLVAYLAMGLNVVNVEYRIARYAHAPAAVEDCRCALRWVIENGKQYGIDTARLVVAGESAGAHLALTTGMLPATAGLDRQCPGPDNLRVAAIIDWYGITDVNELLDGPNMKNYAVEWLGSQPNREEVAKRVSPLTYVRKGLPPVLMIHGDKDQTVPYTQSLRLQKALTDNGVANELMTIPGGAHGRPCCTVAQRASAYAKIRDFLVQHGVLKGTAASASAAR